MSILDDMSDPRNGSSKPVEVPVRCFFSDQAWIEGRAREQLEAVARLDGVKAVAGMPDLNPGKYGPVGCSVLSSSLHPELAGSDIGCGMGLFGLDVEVRKLRIDRAAERLTALEGPWDGDAAALLAEAGLADAGFTDSLGTVGGGNHFCEVQAIEEIVAPEAAKAAGLEAGSVHILVHSGSRGLGAQILGDMLRDGLIALGAGDERTTAYMRRHDEAVAWARINRRLIARRAAEALRADHRLLVDLPHNLVEAVGDGFLHRKGTAPSDKGLVPVPGSRGTLSYLVEPVVPQPEGALASVAHGAGRKYDRSAMHGRIRTSKADRVQLLRNPFGGQIVCSDKDLLVEEAPEAYKSIDRVIDDLVTLGLARVVATFRPLVTFKTAREPRQGQRRDDAKRGRRPR